MLVQCVYVLGRREKAKHYMAKSRRHGRAKRAEPASLPRPRSPPPAEQPGLPSSSALPSTPPSTALPTPPPPLPALACLGSAFAPPPALLQKENGRLREAVEQLLGVLLLRASVCAAPQARPEPAAPCPDPPSQQPSFILTGAYRQEK